MQLLRDNLTVKNLGNSFNTKYLFFFIFQLWTSDTQGDGDEQQEGGDN